MSKIEDFPVRTKSFGNMQNLKFLVIQNTSRYRGDFSKLRAAINHLPWKLKLLDWEHCPMATLPPTFEAKCLVDLRLPYSDIEEISERTLFGKLRRLGFQSCLHLKQIPEHLGNIVELNLSCTNIRELPKIPNLATLEILDLSFCEVLLEIPDTVGNLTALKDLKVRGCRELRSIPDTIGNLSALQTLDLLFCRMLSGIPTSIGNLTALRKLDLSNCQKLRNVPDTVGSLSSLEELGLNGCTMLLEIPSTIGNLNLVKELSLQFCESIRRIPDLIGNCIGLRHITLKCKMLSELSSTIGNITTLQRLWVEDCQNLQRIPSTIGNLTSLEELRLSNCPVLTQIPSTIGDLRSLKDLRFENCDKLGNIPYTIGNLTSLGELYLSGCPMLMEISAIGNLTGLRILEISGCTMILEIPSWIGDLRALQRLSIVNCKKLRKLPDTIGNLTTLESLNLSGCLMLYDFHSIVKNLPSLKYLSPPEDIDCIWEIMKECCSREIGLRDPLDGENDMAGEWEIDPGNQAIQVLRLSRRRYEPNHVPFRCTRLSIFPHLRELSLRYLNIMEIPADLGCLQVLHRLDLSGNDFEVLPASIKQLPLLEQLDLSGCSKIQLIPELPLGLRCLSANDCSSLKSITDVYGHLFHELSLAYCYKLGLDLQQFIQHMILSMHIHKGEIKSLACFSASELPDCFGHQCTKLRLRIPCSQVDSGFKPMGFVAGILVARGGFLKASDMNLQCWLHGEGYQTRHICFAPENSPFFQSMSFVNSDLLFVLSYNFGEGKCCNEISFLFDLEDEIHKIHKIKRWGIRLCFTKELQQAQSVFPLNSGISMQDIDELVEERNFSNLRGADQSEHDENSKRVEEHLHQT